MFKKKQTVEKAGGSDSGLLTPPYSLLLLIELLQQEWTPERLIAVRRPKEALETFLDSSGFQDNLRTARDHVRELLFFMLDNETALMRRCHWINGWLQIRESFFTELIEAWIMPHTQFRRLKIMEICLYGKYQSAFKNVDENRELIMLLQEEAPHLLQCGPVRNCLIEQEETLLSLICAMGLQQDRWLPPSGDPWFGQYPRPFPKDVFWPPSTAPWGTADADNERQLQDNTTE